MLAGLAVVLLGMVGPSGVTIACKKQTGQLCCVPVPGHKVLVREPWAQGWCLRAPSYPVLHGELCKDSDLAQRGAWCSLCPAAKTSHTVPLLSPSPANLHQQNTPSPGPASTPVRTPQSPEEMHCVSRDISPKKTSRRHTGIGKGIITQVALQALP